MKIKTFGIFVVLMIALFAFCGLASATVTIDKVKINGDDLDALGTTILDLQKGEDFDVKVESHSDTDLENVQIEARLRGYDHDDRIEDITDVFDMSADVSYIKKLTLTLPERMDKDEYDIIITVDSRNGQEAKKEFTFKISSSRHKLEIKDIVLSPEISVKAGRALLATVRVKNYGERDEESVKVKVSIPELGVSASDYIDEIESEDSEQSEELYMRIPENTKTGSYEVLAEVIYDDGDEKTTKTTTINVIGEEEQAEEAPKEEEEKIVISIGKQKQDVEAGKAGVVYPIIISNPGKTSKTATISLEGVDWATTSISPSNVIVIEAGESKAVYIYVAAKADATAGEHVFSISISGLSKEAQQIPLTANVIAAKNISSLKKGLEITLITLVIIIVIIGLVIGFRKIKSGEEKEETETYY